MKRLPPAILLGVIHAVLFVACAPRTAREGRDLAAPTRRLESDLLSARPPLAAPEPAPNDPAEDAPPGAAPQSASQAEAPDEPPAAAIACNEQAPQELLIRGNFVEKIGASPEEIERRQKKHWEAIEYRTRRYGYVSGFGMREWNRYNPTNFLELTTFFGIKVLMNKRVIPALSCVEEEIRRACSATPYTPRILDGIRFRNTYHNGEVTNHAYGIAIDIDPDKNSCCGCVPPLNSWPRCKRPAATPYERASIPKCWVDSFTKYGFYWLGNDALEDTMHFEFLGDPDKILKSPASPP